MTEDQVIADIVASENEFDVRSRHLWAKLRIPPMRWSQQQYPGASSFWVVGILGNRCLYFNEVEKGWGWGRFSEWGVIAEYHWQQDEIPWAISQTLFAIDNGGEG
jgi:hypothetical protein